MLSSRLQEYWITKIFTRILDYENIGLQEYWITKIFSNILVNESNIGLREYSLSNACYQGDYKNVALWGCYGQ